MSSSEHLQFEKRRHQYLAAIGVTSWLPRAALPGARPSAESVYHFLYGHEDDCFESDDGSADVADINEADLCRPEAAPVTAASLDLLTPAIKQPGQPRIVEPKSVSDKTLPHLPPAKVPETAAVMPHVVIEPRSSREKAPRFRLGFWLYKDVLVVDSLPLVSRGGVKQEKYQALCANMIKAMGLDATLLVAPYVLAWPMLAGDSLDQGKVQASLAVNHKIHKLLRENTPRLMLFLGESAAQMAMQREESIDELRAVVFNYSSSIKAITSLSLTQMMQIPECKKEVWSDLQKVLPIHV